MRMLKPGGDHESKTFDKTCCTFYFNIRYPGVQYALMHVCRSRLYDSAVYMDCRMPYFNYDLHL